MYLAATTLDDQPMWIVLHKFLLSKTQVFNIIFEWVGNSAIKRGLFGSYYWLIELYKMVGCKMEINNDLNKCFRKKIL